ncbi:MAG: hypothetical protein A2937_03850 [Candidatus Yonathbacteria bacterium RIFCSPLOWO2_01_FULL_47_33b]|uniref:ATP synthase F1 complex delta/epsilon subunit N-terminal domain-containing protein n=1 Tax=Candidatus Yonathbacteria bacterium RIFCSPLOWO2_01_FULL_47_33b TaxID=1802727 RepID=A0A1G2SEE8_9BACT|nr:MAG: hypothetical protein A2937_03850 [Candidatus Yonathbacteria bacterium RIFCSPLOWO2_01_FULL_47_33b]
MLRLIVAQVDKTLFEGEITQVTCPGEMGDLTVLSHHAPLVTPLRAGELKIVDHEGVETYIKVTGGILEVGSNTATILL